MEGVIWRVLKNNNKGGGVVMVEEGVVECMETR